MQFVTVPGPSEGATLSEAGLPLLAYIPDNTLLVRRLPGANLAVLVQTGFVGMAHCSLPISLHLIWMGRSLRPWNACLVPGAGVLCSPLWAV